MQYFYITGSFMNSNKLYTWLLPQYLVTQTQALLPGSQVIVNTYKGPTAVIFDKLHVIIAKDLNTRLNNPAYVYHPLSKQWVANYDTDKLANIKLSDLNTVIRIGSALTTKNVY